MTRPPCAFIRGARGDGFEDAHLLGREDGVEGGKLLVALVALVAQQEAQRVEARVEVGG
jgi:hypothetical protein